MKAKDCMCGDICYCMPNTKISEAAKIMNAKKVGCIPVCNCDKNVVGILTDRDITLRGIACGKCAEDTDVSEIMTCNTMCCDCNEDIEKVTQSMGETGIRRIPVTENGKLIGMLTIGDLAKNPNISCECTGKTFKKICNCHNKNAE